MPTNFLPTDSAAGGVRVTNPQILAIRRCHSLHALDDRELDLLAAKVVTHQKQILTRLIEKLTKLGLEPEFSGPEMSAKPHLIELPRLTLWLDDTPVKLAIRISLFPKMDVGFAVHGDAGAATSNLLDFVGGLYSPVHDLIQLLAQLVYDQAESLTRVPHIEPMWAWVSLLHSDDVRLRDALRVARDLPARDSSEQEMTSLLHALNEWAARDVGEDACAAQFVPALGDEYSVLQLVARNSALTRVWSLVESSSRVATTDGDAYRPAFEAEFLEANAYDVHDLACPLPL